MTTQNKFVLLPWVTDPAGNERGNKRVWAQNPIMQQALKNPNQYGGSMYNGAMLGIKNMQAQRDAYWQMPVNTAPVVPVSGGGRVQSQGMSSGTIPQSYMDYLNSRGQAIQNANPSLERMPIVQSGQRVESTPMPSGGQPVQTASDSSYADWLRSQPSQLDPRMTNQQMADSRMGVQSSKVSTPVSTAGVQGQAGRNIAKEYTDQFWESGSLTPGFTAGNTASLKMTGVAPAPSTTYTANTIADYTKFMQWLDSIGGINSLNQYPDLYQDALKKKAAYESAITSENTRQNNNYIQRLNAQNQLLSSRQNAGAGGSYTSGGGYAGDRTGDVNEALRQSINKINEYYAAQGTFGSQEHTLAISEAKRQAALAQQGRPYRNPYLYFG